MFTGKERDAETGLDYFGALHLNYAIGTRNVHHFHMIPGLVVLSL